MKKFFGMIISIGIIGSILVGCGAQKVDTPQKTEEQIRAEIKAEMKEELKPREELENEIKEEIENQAEEEKKEAVKVDYTLTAGEFMKKYVPDEVSTQDDGGYFMYGTHLKYNDGMDAYVYHDEKDFSSNKFTSITISSDAYKLDEFEIGMSLKDAYAYCEKNYKKFYNHHDEVYVDNLYMIPNSQYTISFNGIGFTPYKVKENEVVKSIALTEFLD